MLTITGYKLAIQLYCEPRTKLIPKDRVEKSVLDAIFTAYDSASNGNKTRGGVKKASEM
jgi:hypothetical protein